MPHATTDIVNGDSSSKTVSHLKSYPVVSDSIETFKSNPYGKKSIEIADEAYARLGKPVEPYLKTPYSYAEPYISKADELGAKALGRVDGHFPIVREKTETIVSKAKGTVFWPVHYLSDTWSDEYNKTTSYKNRGPGVTAGVLSIFSLELRVASDFFHYVADNLRPAYEDTKAKADDLTKSAQSTLGEYEQYGKDKLNQLQGTAEQKGDELKDGAKQLKGTAEKKGEEAKDGAKQLKGAAEDKGEEAKHSAKQTKHDAEKKLHK